MNLTRSLRGLDSRVLPKHRARRESGTFTAAGRDIACAHCGSDQFQQRYWWAAGTGMALIPYNAGLIKQGARSVRHLACSDCGLIMSFIPDAMRPPNVDPPGE